MNSSFWKGKKVFLTGHTGFKGSWLSLCLQQLEADVTGYALYPPAEPNMFKVAKVAQGMKSIIGDIRDGSMLSASMQDAAPEIVIHLAAQPIVRRSYLDPVETYSTNIMGTVRLFEAVRKVPSVRSVVNVTTDKCYENKEWVWGYRETDSMGGFDPYSSSKGCAELVTAAYRNSFFNLGHYHDHGVAIATARAGNVIGGGDWAEDRLIPDFFRSISEGHTVLIRSPNAIRPWQHVLESVAGYLLLAQKLFDEGMEYAEGWNFGPNDNDAKPVKWIIEQIVQRWGENASWQLDQVNSLHEAHYLKLDCSKAKVRLGWYPKLKIVDALDRTVDWYKAYLRGEDMNMFSRGQISDFRIH